MPTEKKIAQVAALKDQFSRAQVVVSADYRGASVGQMTTLRRALRDVGVEVLVVKNRLALLAATQVDHPEIGEILSGPTAIAIGYDDPVASVKALTKFMSDNRNFPVQIIAGWVDGQVLDRAGVEDFAKVPSRDELISMIAGQFQSPLRNFAGLMQATMREFTGLIDARATQLDAPAG